MPKTCGIYKITSPSGKIYIGQSINIEKRLSTYRRPKRQGQPFLHASLRKYGFDSHKFEIIHSCLPPELDFWEVWFIDLYATFDTPHGLNLTRGAREPGRCDHTRKKLSEYNKKVQPWCKTIYVRDLQGNITRYDSMRACSKVVKISAGNISHAVKTKRLCKSSYYFSHTPDWECSDEKRYSHRTIAVYSRDIKGEIIKYNCILACTKKLDISHGAITKAVKSGKLCKKKYYFSLIPDWVPNYERWIRSQEIIVYSQDTSGDIIKFNSISECSKQLGAAPSTIRNVIESKKLYKKLYYFSLTPFK